MADRTCSIEGCDRPHLALGLCGAHRRRKRLGMPLDAKPIRPRTPKYAGCAVTECSEPHIGRGYCRKHLGHWRRHGDPTVSVAVPNRYGTDDDGTHSVTVTRRNGSERLYFFDADDAGVVMPHTWYANNGGYAVSDLSEGNGGGTVFMHRLILGLTPGDGTIVDHVGGDPRNNRRSNLRIVPQQTNASNRAIVNGDGSSRYRGVSWAAQRRRWAAYVKVNYRKNHVGYFDTEEAAAAAVAAFRVKHGLPSGY